MERRAHRPAATHAATTRERKTENEVDVVYENARTGTLHVSWLKVLGGNDMPSSFFLSPLFWSPSPISFPLCRAAAGGGRRGAVAGLRTRSSTTAEEWFKKDVEQPVMKLTTQSKEDQGGGTSKHETFLERCVNVGSTQCKLRHGTQQRCYCSHTPRVGRC